MSAVTPGSRSSMTTTPLRRATRLSAAVLGVLLLGAVAPTAAAAATPTVLYASPNGSGSTCSATAPCDLTGARSKVQSLTAAMDADINVYLRGGVYRLAAAFALG